MKAIILSLLFFLTINAQNVWYVDRDTPVGNSGNGTSWNQAWKTISSNNQVAGGVNYSIINPGDTIYVSGGTDSTYYPVPAGIYSHRIYPGGAGITYASGNPVIITPAYHSGHNGDVYIGARNNDCNWILEVHNISNIKLVGFKFIDTRTAYGTMLYLGGAGADGLGIKDSLITIEDCQVEGNGSESMIYLNGYKITIKNCLIEQAYNSNVNDQDPFGVAGGRGGHIIEGCRIYYRNDASVTTAHRDCIQYSDFGDPALNETVDIIIRNNIIAHLYNGGSWNSMIYSSNPRTKCNIYIYNNILVSSNSSSSLGGIFTYQPDQTNGWTQSEYIFNNTLILKGDNTELTQPFAIDGKYLDTLVIVNNIVVMDAPTNCFLNLEHFYYGVYYRRVDYNAYFEYGGLSGTFYSGEGFGAYTYSQWTNPANFVNNDQYDAHSYTGNSTSLIFANKYGENAEDYYTTTGRDAGVDITTAFPQLYAKFPDINKDILGNYRDSNWDMGALEYSSIPPGGNGINVKSKLYLQGPFNLSSMLTNLSQNGLLPNAQPYNTAPWNYNGNETITSGSNSTYVDWVLVELRSSTNPTQVVARRAAILKNDGTLLNTDGTTGVSFSNVQEGSYYIAVFQRNHLAIMSAAPVQLTATSQVYDFTTGLNKAFGTNPMADLGSGKFGMYASDGNSNGGITITDRNEVWLPQNGTMGYLKGDFNLDGGVTINDINLYWNINNGTMTQVP